MDILISTIDRVTAYTSRVLEWIGLPWQRSLSRPLTIISTLSLRCTLVLEQMYFSEDPQLYSGPACTVCGSFEDWLKCSMLSSRMILYEATKESSQHIQEPFWVCQEDGDPGEKSSNNLQFVGGLRYRASYNRIHHNHTHQAYDTLEGRKQTQAKAEYTT